MSRELAPLAPPALPEAGRDYSIGFFTQYSNVLRLFFQRLSSVINTLVGRDGGTLIEFPSGAFYDLTTQTIAVINTAYPVTFNNVSERRVVLASSSRVTVSTPGLYRIEFTGQLSKVAAGAAVARLWLRKNGADVAGTALAQTVTGGGVTDSVAGQYLISLVEDDYVELTWAANSTGVTLQTTAAAAPVPALPSVILNSTYVSMVRP